MATTNNHEATGAAAAPCRYQHIFPIGRNGGPDTLDLPCREVARPSEAKSGCTYLVGQAPHHFSPRTQDHGRNDRAPPPKARPSPLARGSALEVPALHAENLVRPGKKPAR